MNGFLKRVILAPAAGDEPGVRLARLGVRAAIFTGLAYLVVLAFASLDYAWNWRAVWTGRDNLRHGLVLTLETSLGALIVGLVLGTVGCLLRTSRFDPLRFLGTCYVELVRNTPLLVQLYLAYFCISPQFANIPIGGGDALKDVLPWMDQAPFIGAIALGVFAGAYVTEILRAGLLSIDPGQTEASLSLGLTPTQTLLYVVGPQAFRRVIPPLAGQFVSLVKDSSLLSVISVVELTFMAQQTGTQSFRLFEFYLAIAGLYLAITFPLSRFSVWLERKYGEGNA